jgi:hypothetical protein
LSRHRAFDSAYDQRPVGLLGPTVDPLGELLMRLLPEGLRALLAPAVALPALVLAEPALPLEEPAPAAPVVVPLVPDPAAEAPPEEPLPCAKAALLASASAAANPTVVANLIDRSPDPSDQGQTATAPYVPALAKTLNRRRDRAGFRESNPEYGVSARSD